MIPSHCPVEPIVIADGVAAQLDRPVETAAAFGQVLAEMADFEHDVSPAFRKGLSGPDPRSFLSGWMLEHGNLLAALQGKNLIAVPAPAPALPAEVDALVSGTANDCALEALERISQIGGAASVIALEALGKIKGVEFGKDVLVALDGAYESGHTCKREVRVPAPKSLEPADLEAWWDKVVFPETGDDRPNEKSHWDAVVKESPAFLELVGKTNEWEG